MLPRDKKDFVDVIKLRALIWGDYPGFSGWIQCNLTGPYKWNEQAEEKRCCKRCDNRSRSEGCCAADFPRGRRPKARECVWSLEAGNGKERYNTGALSYV